MNFALKTLRTQQLNDMFATISPAKANRLHWLGRYAERVYMSLHILRKYYDNAIEGDTEAYRLYCDKLHIPFSETNAEPFILDLLYNRSITNSLLSGLELAGDNAIVLREEITSETLSYIQLSLSLMRSCAVRKDTNIAALQGITDYLLAFWGSAEERIHNETIRQMIVSGHLIEMLDMRLRFDYPYARIFESYESLRRVLTSSGKTYDADVLGQIDDLVVSKHFEMAPENKAKALDALCGLMQI